MSRKKSTEESTKEIILRAARKIFFEKGYSKTSVRDILQEANAVTGSFYHFFNSKEELFELAVEYNLNKIASELENIINDSSKNFNEILSALETELNKLFKEYFLDIQKQNFHWSIRYGIQTRIIQALIPGGVQIIERGISEGKLKNPLNLAAKELSALCIQGITAILNSNISEKDHSIKNYETVKKNITDYIKLVSGF